MNTKPVSYRSRFGDPNAPLWGQDALLYSNQQEMIREVVSDVASDDPSVQAIADNFVEYWRSSGHRGISNAGALELIAKVGWLLNEIESAQ